MMEGKGVEIRFHAKTLVDFAVGRYGARRVLESIPPIPGLG